MNWKGIKNCARTAAQDIRSWWKRLLAFSTIPAIYVLITLVPDRILGGLAFSVVVLGVTWVWLIGIVWLTSFTWELVALQIKYWSEPKGSIMTTTQHVFSGICVCGHSHEEHHGNMIMRVEAAEAMKSGVFYGECEHYGFNEDWEPCPGCPGWFVDKDDPLKEKKLRHLDRD